MGKKTRTENKTGECAYEAKDKTRQTGMAAARDPDG